MSVLTPAHRPSARPRRVPRRRGTEAPQPSASPIRVVVGDDDPLYQAGITQVLREAGVDVVASASTADNLARKVRAHHPDVAIVDMEMPPSLTGEDCVEAVRAVRAIDPRMAVLLLSEFAEERYALEVLDGRPEGFGYLLKARIWDTDDLTASVRRVARGGTAIDPVLVAQLAGRRQPDDPMDDLTKREREVLALMAEGRSNRCIADALVVSVTAVERHISSIFAKLDLPPNPAEHRRVLAVLRYLDR
jgi:DNA-binding NarL/FixJ family response regulator